MANPAIPKELIDALIRDAIEDADREREQPTERQEQVKRAYRIVLKLIATGRMHDLNPSEIVRQGMTAQIRDVAPWEVSVAMISISETVLARYSVRDQSTYNKRQLLEQAASEGDPDATLLVTYLQACDRWPDE